jgi:hypothetical protein
VETRRWATSWARRRRLVASDVIVVVLKDVGDWIMKEGQDETSAALVRFLQ